MNLIDLFKEMQTVDASDLFITVGKKPYMRVLREIQKLDVGEVEEGEFLEFLAEHLPPDIRNRLESARDLDIGVLLDNENRYRINLFYQKGHMAMVVRRVPSGALAFADLHLPEIIKAFAETPRGLVLVTGSTGSGKSTTMAAMLYHINSTAARHIVTIEDPIEFVHQDQSSIVSQREVGSDTSSFSESLRRVVRQSPDVIFIGELRDLDTIKTAISAAMTGHLVVTTMHTVDVTQTLDRIINYFPEQLRDQIAMDLSFALRGIVTQRLLPRKSGDGVVPALEILVATPIVRHLINTRDLDAIEDVMKADSVEGMQTFNRALTDLFRNDLITMETGATAATNKDEFLLSVQGMETGIDSLRSSDNEMGETKTNMKILLRAAIRHKASDLLVTVGSAPLLRIDGDLQELNLECLTSAHTQQLLFSILNPAQRSQFELEKEIDFALSVSMNLSGEEEEEQQYRFRANGFYQKGCVSAAIRVISQEIPDPESLGLPPIVLEIGRRAHGLILVTGPTGHGKSTTLACMINQINATRSCHIITIEDPIEYVHTSNKAVIEQREVHADTKGFRNALKYVLRQDPDVILIGEMRDPETIGAALTAAETGHLVLATLHTNDCVQSIDRIIDTFPAHQQNQVRAQLAASLIGVVAQRLLPRLTGDGRVPVFEIMLGTTPIQALIRDNRTHQIFAAIETGAKDGMVTMDKALQQAYRQNLVSRDTVLTLARDNNII